MSDYFFVLVPTDPLFMPDESAAAEAARLARLAFSAADSVSAESAATVQFYDCGANFESVYCPHCDTEMPISAWQDLMDSDFREAGFVLIAHDMPCCGAPATLNELRYDWPQAFGKFAVEVMNPNIAEPPPAVVSSLEAALGCRLRVVVRHL